MTPATLPFVLSLIITPELGYIGPGGGLTALGAVLALVAVGFVTFLGFLWYPIKRLRRKLRDRRGSLQPTSAAQADAEP